MASLTVLMFNFVCLRFLFCTPSRASCQIIYLCKYFIVHATFAVICPFRKSWHRLFNDSRLWAGAHYGTPVAQGRGNKGGVTVKQLKATCRDCGKTRIFKGVDVSEIILKMDRARWQDKYTRDERVEYRCPVCYRNWQDEGVGYFDPV